MRFPGGAAPGQTHGGRPGRPAPARLAVTLAAVGIALGIALPGPALAATVDGLAALAASYGMACTFNKDDVTCTRSAQPRLGLPQWAAVIRPGGGDETSLETAATGVMPLDSTSANWMTDMHQAACGDPKAVDGFVTTVGAMTKPGTLGPTTIGICRFTGTVFGGADTAPVYGVISEVVAPPTSSPGASPQPSSSAAATPGSTPAPTNTPGTSIAPGASATPAPSGSAQPSVAPVASAGASASAPASAGPSGAAPTASPATAVAGETAEPGASSSPEPPTFEESVPGLEEVNTDPRALGGSLVLALLMLLIIGFAGELFNNTVENNYDEISGWFRKGLLGRLRRLGGRLGGRAGVGLLGFVALTALVNSFADPSFGLELRSVAIFLGFLVGLIVVLASFKLPQMLAHRRDTGELGRLRPLPWALAIAVVFVLVSRIGDLQPGYLYGLVLGVLFVKESPERDEGRHTFFASVWTLAAAVLAWLGLGWLRSLGYPEDGFGVTLLSTAFAATLVGGLEAAAFGLMPLRFMPGHAVYQWNRLGWALLFGLSVFAFVHLLIGPDSGYVSELSPAAFVAACGVFAAFGALSLAVWGYFRFRAEPV